MVSPPAEVGSPVRTTGPVRAIYVSNHAGYVMSWVTAPNVARPPKRFVGGCESLISSSVLECAVEPVD